LGVGAVLAKNPKIPTKIGHCFCEFASENHVKFDFFHDLSEVLLFWSTDNGMIYTQLILPTFKITDKKQSENLVYSDLLIKIFPI